MCSADLSVCMWFLDTPDARLCHEIRGHHKFLAVHAATPLLLLACHVGVVPTAYLCIYYLAVVV